MTESKKCRSCREPFTPKQWFQRFCSDKCRQRDLRKRKRAVRDLAAHHDRKEADKS